MKNLRLLFCAVVLTMSFGLMTPALAQSGCNPGEMMGPPCASVQIVTDDATDPGQTQTPPASDAFEITSVLEAAVIAFLLF